jgi:hypothetical protein
MRFDAQSIMLMQRKAFHALTWYKREILNVDGGKTGKFETNPHYVPGKLTSLGMLVQELPWNSGANAGIQNYVFDFSLTAPPQVPGTNNNVNIAKNDFFAIYGIQILFGTGTNSASFVYRSHGVLPADDAIYNSVILMQIESSQYINKLNGQFFRDNPANSNEYFGEIGLQEINPIRVISGEQGKYTLTINMLNSVAGLVTSANTVISFRLHGIYGQKQG